MQWKLSDQGATEGREPFFKNFPIKFFLQFYKIFSNIIFEKDKTKEKRKLHVFIFVL